MPLRFHWRLPQGGERASASRSFQSGLKETGLPDLESQTAFCIHAEESGIDSLLVDFGWSKPDPMLLAAALGKATSKIKFIIAYRSGIISPVSFVQQLNTLSCLIDGRFSLNIVAGHSPEEQRYYGDFLPHDERYARTEEFLTVCHAFWKSSGDVNFSGKYYNIENGRLNTPFQSPVSTSPEIYIAGNSAAAQRLAAVCGSCWMRLPETPEKMASEVKPILRAGKEIGLRLSVIARETTEAAHEAASLLVTAENFRKNDKVNEKSFISASDSVCMNSTYALAENEWLNPYLWTGAVRSHGAPAIAIVGSYTEIARAFLEFGEIGVSQFIISGWPKLEEMLLFGREVIPLVRLAEERKSFAAVAQESLVG